MQDRFKFRVWGGKCVGYLNDYFIMGNGETGMKFKKKLFVIFTEPKNVIFEQCTGLKDKNGKIIFEGDIVTCGDDRKWVIIWDDSFWQVKEIRQDCCININALTWCNCDELEVIGNIHENPELLEK